MMLKMYLLCITCVVLTWQTRFCGIITTFQPYQTWKLDNYYVVIAYVISSFMKYQRDERS